jgi:hypothetical protein
VAMMMICSHEAAVIIMCVFRFQLEKPAGHDRAAARRGSRRRDPEGGCRDPIGLRASCQPRCFADLHGRRYVRYSGARLLSFPSRWILQPTTKMARSGALP